MVNLVDYKMAELTRKYNLAAARPGRDIDDDQRMVLLERAESRIDAYLNEHSDFSLPQAGLLFFLIDNDNVVLEFYGNDYMGANRQDFTELFELNAPARSLDHELKLLKEVSMDIVQSSGIPSILVGEEDNMSPAIIKQG